MPFLIALFSELHGGSLTTGAAAAYMSSPNFIIVSELCVGSLSSLLYGRHAAAEGAKDRLTKKWELVFVRGIATGMAFLHQHNVAHRDLKVRCGNQTNQLPQVTYMNFLVQCDPMPHAKSLRSGGPQSANVLFDRAMMPKVCDFAFSKHEAGSEGSGVEFKSSVGTPQWMAPEVLRGDPYTLSADVWSFGVVVWEILSRCRPYEQLTAYAVTYHVASEGLKLVPPETASAVWKELMEQCWLDPTYRLKFDKIVPILQNVKLDAKIGVKKTRRKASDSAVSATTAVSAKTAVSATVADPIAPSIGEVFGSAGGFLAVDRGVTDAIDGGLQQDQAALGEVWRGGAGMSTSRDLESK